MYFHTTFTGFISFAVVPQLHSYRKAPAITHKKPHGAKNKKLSFNIKILTTNPPPKLNIPPTSAPVIFMINTLYEC